MTIQPEKASCFIVTLESILYNPKSLLGGGNMIQCLVHKHGIQSEDLLYYNYYYVYCTYLMYCHIFLQYLLEIGKMWESNPVP